MGNRLKSVAILLLVSGFAAQAVWAQGAAAGRVKSSTGSVTIIRGTESIPAAVGVVVQAADVLKTGPDGKVSVMLQDNTRLSMGPSTEVALREFRFAPAEGQMAMVLRVTQGVLSYVSGRIAKLAPTSIRIETPKLVIGVRGTHALIKVEAP